MPKHAPHRICAAKHLRTYLCERRAIANGDTSAATETRVYQAWGLYLSYSNNIPRE